MTAKRKDALSRYEKAIRLMIERYPEGITREQAYEICSEVKTNNMILGNLIQSGRAVSEDGEKYIFTIKFPDKLARRAIAIANQKARESVQKLKGTKLSKRFSKFADETLIHELKARGYKISKEITKVVEY